MQNPKEKLTVQEVRDMFSKTIFWNYGEDWPGDKFKDPEMPLVEYVHKSTDPDDEGDIHNLSFESGDVTIEIAKMQTVAPDRDLEGGIGDHDVDFVQHIPVIIPVLLEEIDRLQATQRPTLILSPYVKPEHVTLVDNFPRRQRLDWSTPEEMMIRNTLLAVERLGAHPRLTNVVCMLNAAREELADWVENDRVKQ